MIYPIVKFGSPVLETSAEPVRVFDGELKKLVEDMFESMYAARGVGLAAPQIGIGKRLAVIDVTFKEDPDANCLPQGVPKIDAAPAPWKIVQTPGFIVIVYEAFNLWRQVFLDGRELEPDANPTWMGYSTGKWDGDTLVVDSRGFNGKAWLDQLGKPSTEALHVIERFRRKDFGHMNLQITIDDPKAYTKPWTVNQEVHLLTDTELLEFICNENNRDVDHLPGK